MNTSEYMSYILKTAIDNLKMIGAEFKIILPDGSQYGDMIVKSAVAGPEKQGHKFLYLYKDKIAALQPNETVAIEAPTSFTEKEIATLRDSMASKCFRTWGPGSHESLVEGRTVYIKRKIPFKAQVNNLKGNVPTTAEVAFA